MHELEGQSAVVTGASRGIGAATARELARCGVSVVLAARTLEAIEAIAADIRDGGGSAVALACDVSRYEDVEAAVARCQRDFGRLDILVNNAGVIEPIARLADSPPDQWGRAVDINLKGVYHGLRAAIPLMTAQASGVIVNLVSATSAERSPVRGMSSFG